MSHIDMQHAIKKERGSHTTIDRAKLISAQKVQF